MLLRSSSTPILNSWLPHSKESPEPPPEIALQFPRSCSIVSLSLSSSPISPVDSLWKKSAMTRASSESDLRDAKRKPMSRILDGFEEDEEEREAASGFGVRCAARTASFGADLADGLKLSVLVGGGVGGGGGKICGGGGGGSDGGDDGSSGFWDSNRGNRSTDLYYQKMIEANPGNPLLLSNYAKFLKDVRGDFVKAEEYCGRAILVNPTDASVLSMYADLIWQSYKDSERAEVYFDQAVKAAPDDCFVMASYARFLWDTEEEEEGDKTEETTEISTPFFHGAPPTPPPLAAAS